MLHRLSTFGEYFSMAWTALMAHKLRSVLTTLGILIGVTTIITIFTTIQGIDEYVLGELSNIGSSTVYVQKWPWVRQGDWWKYRNRKEITYKEYEALKQYTQVTDHLSPQVFTMRTIKYRTEAYDRIFVIGTTEEYKDTDNINPSIGRFITETDVHRNHRVCVIGDEIRENLFKDESPLGKRIKIGSNKYTVIGVNEKRGKVFGQSMDNFIIVPFGTISGVMGGHRGMRIAITVGDVDKIGEMKDEVRGILRRVRKVAPSDEDDFALNQQDTLTNAYKALTGTLFAIVFFIGGISLLVGGIGITNIMLVSVTERTREIGIRKAIGAKKRNILTQFIIESVAIASVGGIIGIVFGFIGGTIVLSQMTLSTGVSVGTIMVGYGFSFVIGVLSGFYPAWKAAKMNPIDALHFE